MLWALLSIKCALHRENAIYFPFVRALVYQNQTHMISYPESDILNSL